MGFEKKIRKDDALNETILITGASGQVGRRVAELLSKQGHALRLMVRDPSRAPTLAAAQTVQGDYADPRTLDAAFAGVESAFIVSGYAEAGVRAKLHKNAFDAAARARVKHIVYLSFQGASAKSKFPMSRDHYQTEQYLKASAISFTVLRDNMYMDILADTFNSKGVMRGPAGQGAVAWVSREDVARSAAAALSTRDGSSAIYDITGPEAITMAVTAKRLSTLVGRTLRYQNESVDEGRKWRSALGAPVWEVDTWLGSYEAIAAGELERPSDAVLRLTGRQPLSLEEYFSERSELLEPLRGSSVAKSI